MPDTLSPHAPPKPKSSSRKGLYWALGGCGFVTMLLMCGGGIAAVIFGLNLVEEELKVQLREMPEVQQHLGELTTLEVNFIKSAAINDDEALVYDATGTEGTAEFTIVSDTSFDGPEEMQSATMRLPDGKEIELEVEF